MLNIVILAGAIILIFRIIFAQFVYFEVGHSIPKTDEKFRYALSVSPFTDRSINKENYTYEYNGKQITTVEELEQLYIEKGATEMYVRIAT